jgi:predicted DNA repair protein MutK
MATGLLLLLDDIASVLNDVALLTKTTVSKTAGVMGDDLALNAQQVSGSTPNRELPIVWAVAKGSFVNKAILVPGALLLSAIAPWSISPLMVAGGSYLCFEGCEKLAHKFLHTHQEDAAHLAKHQEILATEEIDVVAAEKEKIQGAVRTDFVLSAEIIVIALGIVEKTPILTRVIVMVGVGVLMTIGVYGLVAAIVKIDDVGAYLARKEGWTKKLGIVLSGSAPPLMKFLTVAGTAAMFFVGGGILAHKWPTLHHGIDHLGESAGKVPVIGYPLELLTTMFLEGCVGVVAGAIVLLAVTAIKWTRKKPATA